MRTNVAPLCTGLDVIARTKALHKAALSGDAATHRSNREKISSQYPHGDM